METTDTTNWLGVEAGYRSPGRSMSTPSPPLGTTRVVHPGSPFSVNVIPAWSLTVAPGSFQTWTAPSLAARSAVRNTWSFW